MVETAALKANVGALFAPRNIVLVGASDRNWSARVHGTLARLGYAGGVFLVNPNRSELWGRKCYPSLAELPEAPDHLAVFVPAEETIATIEAATPLGARSASLFAAGFGEGGDRAGEVRAARLKTALTRSGIAAVGPNCMGLSVGKASFATIPDEHLDITAGGPVAVVTQSGMLIQTLNRGIHGGGAAISCLISCGNQIDLSFADYLFHLAEQDEIRVIACYVESVRDSTAFLAAARRCRERGKTVVVTKIGGSEKARRAALAHTGSLTGNLQAFDVFAREEGIVRAETIEDLVESCIFLAKAPRPKGRGIGLVTISGALKTLATEAGEALGVGFADLAPATGDKLRAALPDVDVSNPLDTKRTLPTDQYMAVIAAVHDDPAVDIVLVAEELPAAAGIDRKLKNFTALDDYVRTEATKPLICFSPITLDQTDYMRSLRQEWTGIAWLRDLSKTLRVVSRLAPATYPPLAPARAPGDSAVRRALQSLAASRAATGALDEQSSKEILRLCGLATPREKFIPGWTVEKIVEAAAALRFPLVAKVVSAAVTHKSDAGLVILNLASADELRSAVTLLAARCAKIGVKPEGVLVAEQLTGGVEVVVGLHRDPEMGLVVMFGAGGVYLELLRDVAFGPPGLDAARARDMIQSTRVAKLLGGYRGAAPGDMEGLVGALTAIGALAHEIGDLVESLEINPLLVRPDGVFALDALIVARGQAPAEVSGETV
jgi:acetyltransferase